MARIAGIIPTQHNPHPPCWPLPCLPLPRTPCDSNHRSRFELRTRSGAWFLSFFPLPSLRLPFCFLFFLPSCVGRRPFVFLRSCRAPDDRTAAESTRRRRGQPGLRPPPAPSPPAPAPPTPAASAVCPNARRLRLRAGSKSRAAAGGASTAVAQCDHGGDAQHQHNKFFIAMEALIRRVVRPPFTLVMCPHFSIPKLQSS
ncbi:hypothetical protein PVAP13_9NG430228 [Panicum virgatum]|uniref:Uncharacterized protein n=1 Tax=Panicum virgatum TaxID=38727 RepID=A0A8T0MMR5_PANVG|nr:hypothetical protein PVAP13_9NG430228 [Panicum virgatum]